MTVWQKYRQKRAALGFDNVGLGFFELYFFPAEDREEGEEAPRRPLPGDWRPNWLEIGYEEESGATLLVDTDDENIPVYWADNFMGPWQRTLIGDSWDGFVKALSCIRQLAEARPEREDLEENPIPEKQIAQTLKKIQSYVPNADQTFWAYWMMGE